MDRESQYQQLIEAMQEAREQYLEITNKYDGFLQQAHEAEHGSEALILAIRNANAIGPELTGTLKKYREAVESLARFFSNL